MQFSELYRCSGCSVGFSDPVAWREGTAVPADPPSGAARQDHDYSTNHMARPYMPGEVVGYGRSEEDLRAISEAVERANRSKGRRR